MDLSTRPVTAANTSPSAPSPSPAHTSSAASRSNPPAKTEHRAHRVRSASEHRSWLHSTVALSVWCRPCASRLPSVRSRNRSSNRARIWSTESIRVRTAASSIASGTPSNRWHTRATASSFWPVSAKPGDTAAARCSNNVSASCRRGGASGPAGPAGRAGRAGLPAAGSDNGGTGQLCSPEIPNDSRLVARTRTPGAALNRLVTSRRLASNRCSQLSRINSSRLSAR